MKNQKKSKFNPTQKKFKQNKNYPNNKNKNNSKNQIIFSKRYEEIYGKNGLNKLIKSRFKLKNNKFIRINLSKANINEIEDFLKKNRVKYSKTFLNNALKIEKSFFNISSSIPYLTGKIYFQDLASQIPINTIDFKLIKEKSQKTNNPILILDMAASPGSKTTQIADLLSFHKIKYKIIALEPNKERLNRLINNIQKQNFKNIEIINIEAQKYKSKNKFDIIILDAPCSGNLIDDKNWINKRDIQGIEQNASLQRKILKNATSLLKENGVLIYSTCSLEPEENEININWLLKHYNLKTERINLNFNFNTSPIKSFKNQKFEDQNSIRITPFNSNTQGFFISKLIKK